MRDILKEIMGVSMGRADDFDHSFGSSKGERMG